MVGNRWKAPPVLVTSTHHHVALERRQSSCRRLLLLTARRHTGSSPRLTRSVCRGGRFKSSSPRPCPVRTHSPPRPSPEWEWQGAVQPEPEHVGGGQRRGGRRRRVGGGCHHPGVPVRVGGGRRRTAARVCEGPRVASTSTPRHTPAKHDCCVPPLSVLRLLRDEEEAVCLPCPGPTGCRVLAHRYVGRGGAVVTALRCARLPPARRPTGPANPPAPHVRRRGTQGAGKDGGG